jgi:2-C-methyl-D-erythritol 2,4-cyclodiphosphate synthase
MAPHIPQMQRNLAEQIGVKPEQVGVKATTSEHLGFTGRKEGIVVFAIASIEL